jgi:hypothetical protein
MRLGGNEHSKGAPRSATDGEPTVRGNMLRAFRAAAAELWDVAVLTKLGDQLSADTRRSTVDALFILADARFPERYVLEWLQAVWQGPCGRDHAKLRSFMGRVCAHGFARMRRLLLEVSSPEQLVEKAAAIWESQHSHGKLTMELCGANQLRVRLSDHLYVESPVTRTALGEFYRYVVSLCRGVREVDEFNNRRDADGAFSVDLRWR